MNIEGFDLEDKEIRTFLRTFEELQKKYSVRVIDCDKIENLFEYIAYLRTFQLLNHYRDFQIINIFRLNEDSHDIRIINVYVSYIVYGERGSVTEAGAILNFGIVEVPIDLGNGLITPETPVDKILDFFLRRDINFKENKEFSDKFYLVGTNKNLLRSKITPTIQNQLVKTPKIEVEINRTKVLARFDSSMTIKRTLAIAELLKKFKN